jgi:hypothetical protein
MYSHNNRGTRRCGTLTTANAFRFTCMQFAHRFINCHDSLPLNSALRIPHSWCSWRPRRYRSFTMLAKGQQGQKFSTERNEIQSFRSSPPFCERLCAGSFSRKRKRGARPRFQVLLCQFFGALSWRALLAPFLRTLVSFRFRSLPHRAARS